MGQVPALALPDGLLELAAVLEAEWPARTAALRASGVPLAEVDEAAKAKAEAEAKAKADDEAAKTKADAEAAAKPPWGDEKDFDPERAWKLIQDTRADREKIKTDRDVLSAKEKERTDAAKTEQEKAAERTAAAEETAKSATSEAARLRVALKKGLTESQAKRLIGDTEEDLENDADELLASFKTEDGGQEPRRTPRERLRPGAAPGADLEETDPAKLAASVPRPYR